MPHDARAPANTHLSTPIISPNHLTLFSIILFRPQTLNYQSEPQTSSSKMDKEATPKPATHDYRGACVEVRMCDLPTCLTNKPIWYPGLAASTCLLSSTGRSVAQSIGSGLRQRLRSSTVSGGICALNVISIKFEQYPQCQAAAYRIP